MENSNEVLLTKLTKAVTNRGKIDPTLYGKYNVKRGLRNNDGTGVLVGLTEVGEVMSYIVDDAERVPVEGKLFYRGYEVSDLVKGFYGKRYGFEEISFLLLTGELPTEDELNSYKELLSEKRPLPFGFTEDMILKAPSPDVMNKLARSVLALYSYDENPDSTDLNNVVRQCIDLIARFPVLVAYGYMARRHYVEHQSLYIHDPRPEYNTAENILHLIRPDGEFNELEAWDVLKPRVDIVAIDITTPKEEIQKIFMETGYSRLPVYEEDLDRVLGVLNQKDFSNYIKDTDTDIKEYVMPVLFCSGSIKLSLLLKRLQKEKSHMAIIVDEYGGTAGLLTMEDIIEEIVGDIQDEFDKEQEDILNIVFRIADAEGLLLIDTKDLKAMLSYVAENVQQYASEYGNMSKASINVIIRGVTALESTGGEIFFGEPALDIKDWFQVDDCGKGMINILDSVSLINSPKMYATFMLWMLTELYETMPEVGDLDRPKMVFFFDEAHLLFNDMPKILLQKIEQVVKLCRSKGIGIFFITQTPKDIPDGVLSQLGNKIQHALHAYTPSDMKAVKVAADSFRPNPAFKTVDAIQELKTGEALVSCVEPDGSPAIVKRTRIVPPLSFMGAISDEEREKQISGNALYNLYKEAFDRDSAYEFLNRLAIQTAEEIAAEQEKIAQEKADAKARAEAEKQAEKERIAAQKAYEREIAAREKEAQKQREAAEKRKKQVAQNVAKTTGSTIGREVGKVVGNSIGGSFGKKLGSSIGSSLGRGILGNIFWK